jgi:SAM-dependent methyltransferase
VTFRRCGSCGSLADVEGQAWEYRSPEPPPEAIEQDLRLILEGATPHRALAGHVQALHGSRPGEAPEERHWLDVGAHLGLSCEFADRLGYRVTGLEPGALRRGSEALFGRPLRAQRLEDLAHGEERYDRLLLSEVIEHVPDPRTFLTSLRAVTAPGGLVLLTTPDADLLASSGHAPELDGLYCPGHHRHLFTPRSLRRLLHRAGFGGVEIRPGTSASPSLLALASPSPRACPPVPSPRTVRRGVRRWLPEVLEALARPPSDQDRLRGLAARSAAWARVELHEAAGETATSDRIAGTLAREVGAERWLEETDLRRLGLTSPAAYLRSFPGFAPGLCLALGRAARRRGCPSTPSWLRLAGDHARLQLRLGTFMPGPTVSASRLELAAWELEHGEFDRAEAVLATPRSAGGLRPFPGRREGTRRLLQAHSRLARGDWLGAARAVGHSLAGGRLPIPLAAWPAVRRAATRLGL